MARPPPGPMWRECQPTTSPVPLVTDAGSPLRGASHTRFSRARPPVGPSPVAAWRPLGKAHGLLGRLEQGAGFVEALLLFRRGIAVGDNPGTRLHVDRAVLHERRAQDDAAVHLAIGREVAHAASIGSALLLLELI